jgi:hypothetical protein
MGLVETWDISSAVGNKNHTQSWNTLHLPLCTRNIETTEKWWWQFCKTVKARIIMTKYVA